MKSKNGKDNSYFSDMTADVVIQTMFERDFKSPGQFYEKDDNDELNLVTDIWIQKHHAKSFNVSPVDDPEQTSYRIDLIYFNKENIRIEFNASYGMDSSLQPTFDFIKAVAKKFYLVPDIEFTVSEQVNFADSFEPTWEEIEIAIAKCKSESNDIRTGNSWYKTMTTTQMKELLAYVNLEVELPE